MNPARHMQGEKTMQPDNLHEILRQSKVLPLSLGRDGEMWWPDGLLLDGIKKRLPAYREAVLPKERAEFDAALDAAWKYGEVVFDHTVCPGGGNCLHARLRLRRVSPDECRGILRMVPEKSAVRRRRRTVSEPSDESGREVYPARAASDDLRLRRGRADRADS